MRKRKYKYLINKLYNSSKNKDIKKLSLKLLESCDKLKDSEVLIPLILSYLDIKK